METVSANFRNVLYSGGAEHTAILTIGNTTIDTSNIKRIEISNPIIDTTSSTFYIGTFISKQLDIEFYNANNIDLNGRVHLQIGTKVDTTTIAKMDDIIFEYLPELSDYLDQECKIIDVSKISRINSIITIINRDITTLSLSISSNNIIANNNVEYTNVDTMINEIETKANTIKNNISYETLNIGYFNIETSAEDYYANAKITCLDDAIKFKPNVDYSEAMYYTYSLTSDTTYQINKSYYHLVGNVYTLMVEGTDYTIGDNIPSNSVYEQNAKSITALELLQWLCTHFGVTLGTYPNVNNNISISTYDGSVSGKQYISYIAEIMGGNACITRAGNLNIVPLNNNSVISIDGTQSKSWELGDKYEIKKVVYFDAIRKYENGSDTANTYYIRSDNPFVVGTESECQTIVYNVYNAIKDVYIYNVKCENVGDYSLDQWDYINYSISSNPPFLASDYIDEDFDWSNTSLNPLNAFYTSDIKDYLTNIRSYVNDNGYLINNNNLDICNENIEYINFYFDSNLEDKYDYILNEETSNNYKLYNITQENYFTFREFCKDIFDIFDENGQITTDIYKTINNTKLVYEMNIMSTVETTIPNEQVEETTNVVEGNDRSKYNRLRTTIDKNNNQISLLASQYDGIEGQTEELIISQVGLSNSFSTKGGTNLWYNTGLHFKDDKGNYTYWDTTNGTPLLINDSDSLSKTDIGLINGNFSQTINITPNTYTNSFMYKKINSGASAYYTINGERKLLGNETEWTKVEDLLFVSNNNLSINFECNVNGGYFIKELMLNKGDTPSTYSQNANEMRTDTVQISDGIVVSSSGSDTISRHDADGFRIVKKEDENDVLFKATSLNGVETTNIIAKNKSEIANLIINKYNGHTLLSNTGGD